MKFGFYFEHSGENDNDEINVSACPTCTNNQNGQFQFTDSRSGFPSSGNAIANVALGLFDSYSELGQRAYTLFRGSSYEPYAQDSWKVNQKLTLNYGVRYTVTVPYSALWRNMIVFDPTLYDPSKAVTVIPTGPNAGQIVVGNGDRYNGMVIPGSGFPDSAKGRFPAATDPRLLISSAAEAIPGTIRIFNGDRFSRASALPTSWTRRQSFAPAAESSLRD